MTVYITDTICNFYEVNLIMKTRDEIKEKLDIYKKIKEKSAIFTSEFELACGAITALEWVLEDTENEKV